MLINLRLYLDPEILEAKIGAACLKLAFTWFFFLLYFSKRRQIIPFPHFKMHQNILKSCWERATELLAAFGSSVLWPEGNR